MVSLYSLLVLGEIVTSKITFKPSISIEIEVLKLLLKLLSIKVFPVVLIGLVSIVFSPQP